MLRFCHGFVRFPGPGSSESKRPLVFPGGGDGTRPEDLPFPGAGEEAEVDLDRGEAAGELPD